MLDLFSQCSTGATRSRQAAPCAHTPVASSWRFVHLAHPFGAPTCRRGAVSGTSQSTEARYPVSENATVFSLTGRETPVNVSISVSIIAPALSFAAEAPVAPAAGAADGIPARPALRDAVLVLEAAPSPATEATGWLGLRNDLVAANVAWIVRLVLRGASTWDGCQEHTIRGSDFLSCPAGQASHSHLTVAHTGDPSNSGACAHDGQMTTLSADAATAQALALAIHPICEHMATPSKAAPGVVSPTSSSAQATTAATTAVLRLTLLTDDTLAPLGPAIWTCLHRRLGHLLPGQFLLDGEPIVVRYAIDQTPDPLATSHATRPTPPVRYGFTSCRVALGAPDEPERLDGPYDSDGRHITPRSAFLPATCTALRTAISTTSSAHREVSPHALTLERPLRSGAADLLVEGGGADS